MAEEELELETEFEEEEEEIADEGARTAGGAAGSAWLTAFLLGEEKKGDRRDGRMDIMRLCGDFRRLDGKNTRCRDSVFISNDKFS